MNANITEVLIKNDIVIGLIWEPNNSENDTVNYRPWIDAIKKNHNQIQYLDKNGKKKQGYTNKPVLQYDPFAIHMNTTFGDGIYYSVQSPQEVYFLIIHNGQIMSGSDMIVTREYFDEVMRLMPNSELKELNLVRIEEHHIETVIQLCEKRKKTLRKQRVLIFGSLLIVGIIIIISTFITLKVILSG